MAHIRLLALLTIAALAVGACSGNASAPTWTYPPAGPVAVVNSPAPSAVPAGSIDHDTHHTSPTAVPASDGEVVITMTDAMRFEPGVIEVTAAKEVTFVVKNAGVIPHDFFVGDQGEQEHHAAEMAEPGSSHHHDDALRLEAGESGRMTMTFDKSGPLLIGCHEPGHYEAGMVGSLTVVD